MTSHAQCGRCATLAFRDAGGRGPRGLAWSSRQGRFFWAAARPPTSGCQCPMPTASDCTARRCWLPLMRCCPDERWLRHRRCCTRFPLRPRPPWRCRAATVLRRHRAACKVCPGCLRRASAQSCAWTPASATAIVGGAKPRPGLPDDSQSTGDRCRGPRQSPLWKHPRPHAFERKGAIPFAGQHTQGVQRACQQQKEQKERGRAGGRAGTEKHRHRLVETDADSHTPPHTESRTWVGCAWLWGPPHPCWGISA